jgi:hypothetical protein
MSVHGIFMPAGSTGAPPHHSGLPSFLSANPP